MRLEFSDAPATMPCKLADRELLLAAHCMSAANGRGALVDFNITETAGFPSVYYVAKLPDLRRENGIHVIGSITLPFTTCSYTLRIEMPEGNTTGLREAVILDQLLQAGEIDFDPITKEIRGWTVDQQFAPDTLRANRADDPIFDQFFPEHPLTIVRYLLNRAAAGSKFDPTVAAGLVALS